MTIDITQQLNYSQAVRKAKPDWDDDKVRMAAEYLCLLYTSPSPRDVEESRMPSSA